jgi:hypothetical protein
LADEHEAHRRNCDRVNERVAEAACRLKGRRGDHRHQSATLQNRADGPELLDRFRAALEQRNPDNRTAPNSDRIGELGAEIATSRGRESDEIRDLRRSAVTMALSLLVAPSSEPMPSTVESAAAMDYVLVPAIECKSNGDRS